MPSCAATLVLAVLACAALAGAQTPKPCVLEGSFTVRVDEFDHKTGDRTRYLLTYDAASKRIHQDEEAHARTPGMRFYQYLFLFDTNELYKIQRYPSQSCTKSTIPFPWREFQIPSEAKLLDTSSIGNPGQGDGTLQEEWGVDNGVRGFWAMRVTQKTCTPLFEVFGNTTQTDKTLYYFDYTVGIPDPNIFIPPSFCA